MMMQSDPIESTASNRTILDCIVPTKSAKLYDQLGHRSHLRFMMGFNLHSGEDPLPITNRMCHPRQLSRCVEPLTQEQGDVSWYIMRRHSCTSSAMDIVLRKKASFIEVYHQVRDEYEIVFAYAGINIPLPGCIRTQTTTACARILLYYGVLFHRLCQWTSGKKDIKSYASATHARN
jgi:hypothetical protein